MMSFMKYLFHGTFWKDVLYAVFVSWNLLGDGLVRNRLENDQELFNSSFINHVEKGKTSATVV